MQHLHALEGGYDDHALKFVILSKERNDDPQLGALLDREKLRIFQVGDSEWIHVRDVDDIGLIEDIADHKGQLCMVCLDGRSFMMDSSFSLTEIRRLHDPPEAEVKHYVADSSGDIYLAQYCKITNSESDEDDEESLRIVLVYVYKLCEETHRWIQVAELGGEVLLLVMTDFHLLGVFVCLLVTCLA